MLLLLTVVVVIPIIILSEGRIHIFMLTYSEPLGLVLQPARLPGLSTQHSRHNCFMGRQTGLFTQLGKEKADLSEEIVEVIF